jgi:tetratricopeptide (TPR) repeat protein
MDAGAGPCDVFITTAVEIGRNGGVQERLAVMEIVDFRPLAAERRYSTLIDEASATDGGEPQSALLWRMAALFAPTEPAMARSALERMLALDPQACYARFTLATVLQRLGDAAAENAYHSVVVTCDDNPSLQVEALDRLGYLAMSRGQLDEATFNFERSLRLHRKLGNRSGLLAILHELAEAAEQSSEIEKAERYLHQALDLLEGADHQSRRSY